MNKGHKEVSFYRNWFCVNEGVKKIMVLSTELENRKLTSGARSLRQSKSSGINIECLLRKEWVNARYSSSSETQGRSVGRDKRRYESFQAQAEKLLGYRLSPDHFQTIKQMLAPDWAQKMLCIIVPNQRTASPEFFSWVRTRRLLTRPRLVWLMHQRNARTEPGKCGQIIAVVYELARRI